MIEFSVGNEELYELYQEPGRRTEAGGETGLAKDVVKGMPYGSPSHTHIRTGKQMRKHLERKSKMLPPMSSGHGSIPSASLLK